MSLSLVCRSWRDTPRLKFLSSLFNKVLSAALSSCAKRGLSRLSKSVSNEFKTLLTKAPPVIWARRHLTPSKTKSLVRSLTSSRPRHSFNLARSVTCNAQDFMRVHLRKELQWKCLCCVILIKIETQWILHEWSFICQPMSYILSKYTFKPQSNL